MKKEKNYLTCNECAYLIIGVNIDKDECGLGEDYCNRECPACCMFEESSDHETEF